MWSSQNWNCDQPGTIYRSNGEQFLAGKALRSTTGTLLLRGADPLLIQQGIGTGSTWTGPDGIEASVISSNEGLVLNAIDSSHVILFSSGDTLTISRDHGLLSWHNGPIRYDLVGINGTGEGTQLPDMLDLFDYLPGDVLEYHGEGGSTDGICNYSRYWTRKYTIISRSETPGRSDYQLRLIGSYQSTGIPLIGGWSCGSYYQSQVDTLSLGVVHAHWTPENFFGNRWIAHFWPGAMDTAVWNDLYQPYAMILNFRSNDVGQYSIGGRAVDQWGQAHLLCPSDDDSTTYSGPAQDEMDRTYEERIGYTGFSYLAFEHSGTEHLFASIIRGVPSGTITPDDIVLSTPSRVYELPELYPNPADQELWLSETPEGGSWRIFGPMGQLVASGRLRPGDQKINTSSLPEGAYVLQLGSGEMITPQRFIIAR